LIHRQICENKYLWDDKPFARGQAWIDLIMDAAIADKHECLRGETFILQRGSLKTTIRELSNKWGWSKTKVLNFLNSLQSASMAKIESDTKKTVITIVNYEEFQHRKTQKGQREDTQKDTRRTPSYLNKEYKERECGKHTKKDTKKKHGEYGWVCLTDEELNRLIKDHGKETVDYYIGYIDESAQQTGNKNKWKDWNLTIRKAIRGGWGRPPSNNEPIDGTTHPDGGVWMSGKRVEL